MASSIIGFVDINGIVHRLSDVSATFQSSGAQSTIATVDSGNVQTPAAKVVLDAALAAQAAAPDAGDRVDVVSAAYAEDDEEAEVPFAVAARARVILADSTAAFSIQLPDPATFTGILTIKDTVDASAENITLLRHDAEEINGAAASYVMDAAGEVVHLVTNGTDWFLV